MTAAKPIIELREDSGFCWSVFVDGQRLVDRESFAIADRVATCLRDEDAYPFTESREVADAILRWRTAEEGRR